MREKFPAAGRGEIFAWCWYDFSNSAFVTVVITVVGGVFFTRNICGGAPWAEFAWGCVLSASAAMAMVAGPFLGRWTDHRASKKPALVFLTVLCVAGTFAFGWPRLGMVGAMGALVLANCAFLLGENLVAAFLPELAEPGRRGRVSAYGWAFGYVGGLASLALALRLIGEGGSEAIRSVFSATAAFMFLAALPTMLFLRERAVPGQAQSAEPGWRAILRTVQGHPELIRLLLGLAASLSGLSAVVGFASIYASREIGFTLEGTVKLFVCLQVAAAAGALLTGSWQDRAGTRRVLLGSLAVWGAVSVGAFLSRSPQSFYGVAALAGLAMGWMQSAGRAAVADLTPPGREGELFGLWGFAGKLAGIVGPLLFGGLVTLFGMRASIILNGVWFFLGAVLLARVQWRNAGASVEPAGQ
ncbi:MAG: MFS transporter [Verrucomicrobia bacterium]|nr:MFS transporter [Verrucomicrobiota bacterium]